MSLPQQNESNDTSQVKIVRGLTCHLTNLYKDNIATRAFDLPFDYLQILNKLNQFCRVIRSQRIYIIFIYYSLL